MSNLQICSLRSGSKGNAVLVFTEKTKILVDCGISGKNVESCLSGIDISATELDAILITHEHSDHTNSVGVMSRRYNLPIFANTATFIAMMDKVGKVDDNKINTFKGNQPFEIGDIAINPFSIPHDAADPVGYSFFNRNKKVSVATDMGHLSDESIANLQNSDTVLLEANHDLNLLSLCHYPAYLKQRIKSDIGHLSNDTAAKLAVLLATSGTRQILLGHLSDENNNPHLAFETVNQTLRENSIKTGKDIMLDVATRYDISKIYQAS